MTENNKNRQNDAPDTQAENAAGNRSTPGEKMGNINQNMPRDISEIDQQEGNLDNGELGPDLTKGTEKGGD